MALDALESTIDSVPSNREAVEGARGSAPACDCESSDVWD